MAELLVEGSDLVVRLTGFEKVGALRGNVRVPLSSITDVGIEAESGRARRGLRAPGTGMPTVLYLGNWWHRGGRDFLAIEPRKPAVRIDLSPGGRYVRLLVTVRDPHGTAADIEAARGATPGK